MRYSNCIIGLNLTKLSPRRRRERRVLKGSAFKGRVKEAAGVLIGNKKLKREGKADQTAGKIKQKVEEVIDKVKDATS
jgi:uncharacterized protein YjbJ (UPF0337 family)